MTSTETEEANKSVVATATSPSVVEVFRDFMAPPPFPRRLSLVAVPHL
jgi:hypothetical protein